MGACYSSKSGRDTLDKQPYMKTKPKGSLKNGHSPHIEYFAVTTNDSVLIDEVEKDVNTNNEPDKQDTELDKSQQTSLDHVAEDANKNIETLTGYESGQLGVKPEDIEGIGVAASDSGIDVDNTDNADFTDSSTAVGSDCQLHGSVLSDSQSTSDCLDKGDPKHKVAALNLKLQSSTCSSSEMTFTNSVQSQTEHSSCGQCMGECHGHLFQSESNRSSESLILKSSLKKGKSKNRKKNRLSWKSADRLDLDSAMETSLDRTKSEASDIFGDDISLNAPLATFDSVDFALGSSYDFAKKFRTKSCIEYCSDTFQFKFDFSGLDKDRRSSGDRICESDDKDQSVTDLDKIKFAIQRSSVTTPTEHRSFCEGDTSYELPPVGLMTSGQQPEVTTMNLNGREVVVIDQELFSQILDEIQFLKMKLSQLTEVIQDDPGKTAYDTQATVES